MKPKMQTRRKSARTRRKSVQQLVLERGSIAQFARDLSELSGQEVSWARVNNWILRDSVSKSMAIYVHQLTRAPLTDLLS